MLTILPFIDVNSHITGLGGHSSRTVSLFYISQHVPLSIPLPSCPAVSTLKNICVQNFIKTSLLAPLTHLQSKTLYNDLKPSPKNPQTLNSSALLSFCQAAQTLTLPVCDEEPCSSYWPEIRRRKTCFESHSHLALENLVKFVLGHVTMVFFLLVTMAAQERHDVTEHLQCMQFSSPSTRPRKTAWQ